VRVHRPWPLPDSAWIQAQTWNDLLFAHWRVPADQLRRHLPAELQLDLFEGEAWLGITPFSLTGLRPRGVPPAPVLSHFLELNVRTYVSAGGKPGIWFFSLDASSRLAVWAARRSYRLPYFHATMAKWRDRWLEFRSRRDGANLLGRYAPAGPVEHAPEGTLEYFLTERYCLYAHDGTQLYRAEIHHPPWPLQRAQAEIRENTMAPRGVELPAEPPLLHYARRQDVVAWSPEALR
jgi:uncharacterized protein YqjF (DUF2071 family)